MTKIVNTALKAKAKAKATGPEAGRGQGQGQGHKIWPRSRRLEAKAWPRGLHH